MKEQRFVAIISFFIWAEDEAGAKKQAQTLVEEQRYILDNRASVDRIYHMPFGSLMHGDDVDLSDIETATEEK